MTWPPRPTSLRLRIFIALAAATLCGALATGLYAVVADRTAIGFTARLVKVTPKALALAAFLLPAAAVAAAFVGRRLARPIEDLTEAATRIAEGHRTTRLPRGEGDEMRRLARALVSMRRELEGKPYAAAFLRDAWHDLKTPVAALQATLEVLDDDAFDDPVAARHFLVNLRKSTDHQRLEQQAGRQRPYRNAPRTLDLDLLLYGSARIESARLRVPHPRMMLRAFVLVPLVEIAPNSVSACALAAVSHQAVERLGSLAD